MAGDVELQTTWSYTGTRWPDFANEFELPAYLRWDACARWTSTDQHWMATVFVRNLFDEITYNEFYPLSSFAGPLLGALTALDILKKNLP
jgi:outer membrane receptor protein involved in Fe transport